MIYIDEKIRVRVSDFTEKVLLIDAGKFEFRNNKDEPNINGLLNKLIPNLIELRKRRREVIHSTLQEEIEYDAEQLSPEELQIYFDRVIDKVYFADENEALISDIWLRPSKENLVVFDEILEWELQLTRQNVSEYIRSLLNEYIHLPQYKREQIVFAKELNIFNEAAPNSNIVHLTYDNIKYRVVIINYYYGYAYAQENYVLCYDIKNNVLKSLLLHRIKRVYAVRQRYKLSDDIYDTFMEITENGEFHERDTFAIREHSYEEVE